MTPRPQDPFNKQCFICEQPIFNIELYLKPNMLPTIAFLHEAPPVGKIHPLIKIASDLYALQDLESLKKCQFSLFYHWKVFVEQPLTSPGSESLPKPNAGIFLYSPTQVDVQTLSNF